MKSIYQTIVLKLSGEALADSHDAGGDPAKYLEKIIETQKRPTVPVP